MFWTHITISFFDRRRSFFDVFDIATIFIVGVFGEFFASTLAVGIKIEWFGKFEGKVLREGLVILSIDSDHTSCES